MALLANVARLEITNAYLRSPIEASGPPSKFYFRVSCTTAKTQNKVQENMSFLLAR
jgi:hypothetical protein